MWLFSIFIGNHSKHKITDIWRCTNGDQCVPENQVTLVGQQHEALGLEGRSIGAAHVGQTTPCDTSHTAEYAHMLFKGRPGVFPVAKIWTNETILPSGGYS